MSPNEIQALKIIWKNKGKASLAQISRELRVSTDYSRLICEGLIKNKIVNLSGGQYKITNLGKKELERLGVIKKVSKKRVKKVKKVRKTKRPKKEIRVKKEKKRAYIKPSITKLSNLTPELIEELCQKGFQTLEDVATVSVSRLMEAIEGLELKKAASMINEAREKLKKEGKEYLWEGNESWLRKLFKI